MPELDKKNYKLSIYLLKDAIKDFSDALKNGNVDEFDFNESVQVEGKVYIGKPKKTEADWRELLQNGIDKELPPLDNASNRAVAMFKVEGHIYVIPFGYGKFLLKDDVIDRDFGLKTALNIVNADLLQSIDKANIGDMALHTRTQASRKGNPNQFNIDVIKDLLRSVTGEPTEVDGELFGNVITGNEAVYISPYTNISSIPDIIKKLDEESKKDTYKNRFDWIDNIRVEKDPTIIEQLRNNLINDIKGKNDTAITLSPPYILDWEKFENVSYTEKGVTYTNFDINDFYREKDLLLPTLDWDRFSAHKIYIKESHSDFKYSPGLWRFINYDTEYDGCKYLFTMSAWYKVDARYYEEIRSYCEKFEESSVVYMTCPKTDDEGRYNARLAASSTDYILMDKNLVRSEISRSQIEACDVLTNTGEFIHLKFRSSSATLSHLFAQGRVSSYSLLRDRDFRKNLRTKIAALGFDRDLIPLENRDFKTSDFTVTFAVIETKARSFVASLPFFSLINFRLTAQELNELGYNVRVKNILIV